MGNGFKRWLACVFPCGALDLIRVVHLNGHVEEFSHPLSAGEILDAAPGHVLTKLPSSHGVFQQVSILLPESQLKRGGIYFLIPSSSLPDHRKQVENSSRTVKIARDGVFPDCGDLGRRCRVELTKKPRRRDRRSSRGCAEEWQPHLESINED